MNRRAIALMAVFALALSGTGLASLAVIHDDITIAISGTATRLDFQVNGTKHLAIDFGPVERGTIKYVPIHYTNSGNGYVNVDGPIFATTNGSEISTTTRAVALGGGAATCNATGNPVADWSTAPLATAADIFNGNHQIDAGNAFDVCMVYQVGGDASLGAPAAGGTVLALNYSLAGYYP